MLLSPNDPYFLLIVSYLLGALVFEVGYHPGKKKLVIRVVFQDQAMYAGTSFKGVKMCKIFKKGCFWSY